MGKKRSKRRLKIVRTQYLKLENFSKFQAICAYYNVSVSAVLDNFIEDYIQLHQHVLRDLESRMMLPIPGERFKESFGGRRQRGLANTSIPNLLSEIGSGEIEKLPGIDDL